jgi:putative spermidine/putrescine transport system permease protein
VDKKRRNAGLVIAAVVVVLPFFPMVLWAFAGEWRFPELLPAEFSLRGWEQILSGGNRVPEAIMNSLVIGVAATAASVAVGLPAGMAVGGYEFRFKGAVVFLILLPIIVPPLASTMGIHLTFIRLGLSDTVFGVFLVHLIPTVPYTAIILASVFADMTGEMEEAARSLGASPWRAFRHVTLPQAVPGIAVASLFAFLVSWSQYILTVLIGGGSVITLPMLLFSAASGNDPVITSVLAILFAFPALVVLVVALRFLKGDNEPGMIGLGKPS